MENISFRSVFYGIIVLAIIGVGIYLFVNSQRRPPPNLSPRINTTITPTKSTPQLTPTANQTQDIQVTDTPQVIQTTIQLTEQNGSGESGRAIITETDGSIRISISLNGAPADTIQPAHIHSGSCPNPGGILYDLTPPLNGESETTLGITLSQIKSQLPLAINIHKSETEQGTYVACGNINLP